MNENPTIHARYDGQYGAKNVIDLLVVLTKWRRFIVTNLFFVTLGTAIVSLFLPKWYASTASVLPLQNKWGLFGEISGISNVVQDFSKTLGKLGSASGDVHRHLAILKSRTTMEKIIREFNLRLIYDIEENAPIEDVILALEKNVYLAVHEEGNVTVTVYDQDPKRAADMANYFVKTLNDISIELSTREAKNSRDFIERRYQEAQNDLRTAEDALRKFQEKYGVYAMPEQTKMAIRAAAELKSQILIKEVEVGVMEHVFENGAAKIQKARIELSEMNKKLTEMKFGAENWQNGKAMRLFVPFNDVPALGMEYIRVYRDFEIRNKIIAFLLPIYEQAKIEEQKKAPIVLVLDKALPAEKKARPRRMLIVLFAACASLFLSVFIVLFYEAWQRVLGDPERYQKMQNGVILPLQNRFNILAEKKPKQ